MLYQNLLQDIFEECINQKLTIITMESCTGGLISSAITDVPGSSKVFDRGLTTYSNESKIELLDVSKKNLNKYGAVSCEVVSEMASKLIFNMQSKTKISIATSGVAGPRETERKPVGLVWLASYRYNNLIVKKLNLGNRSRNEIRNETVFQSLKLLQENLQKVKK